MLLVRGVDFRFPEVLNEAERRGKDGIETDLPTPDATHSLLRQFRGLGWTPTMDAFRRHRDGQARLDSQCRRARW